MTIFFSVLFPLCFGALFYIVAVDSLFSDKAKAEKENKISSEKAENEKSVFRLKIIMIFFLEFGIFLLLAVISETFMFNDGNRISPFALFISGIFPFVSAVVPYCTKNKGVVKFFKAVSVCAFVLLLAEVVIFNGKSFTSYRTDRTYTRDEMTLSGNAENQENGVVITGDGSVEIIDLPENTGAVIIDMEQEYDSKNIQYLASIFMKDDNFSSSYIIARLKYTMGYGRNLCFDLKPYGRIRELRLDINGTVSPVTIYGIRAVSAVPFEFSLLRYIILMAVSAFIAAVKEFRLYKITFSFRKKSHIVAAEILAVICSLSALLFYPPEQKPIEYDGNISTTPENAYVMLFDAFKKGQVYLDCETAPEIENIENIYSPDQRAESEGAFNFDYAYYNGKYYCYFGAAPVLTLYFPYYWITGKLPPVAFAVMFFSVFAIFFFCQALLEAVRLLVPRPNLLLLLGAIPSGVICVGVEYLLNIADIYALPIASGLCWLFLSLWVSFRACSLKKGKLRLVLLAVGGASLALCVASRPGMSFNSAVLVPLFLGILLNRKEKFSYRIAQTCSFVIPLLVGGSLVMLYNYVRFGSPFDFGAVYQLTVSDIHANNVRFSGIPATIFHYFIQIPSAKTTFPFFDMLNFSTYNYGASTYMYEGVGALVYPMVFLGILMIPDTCQRSGNRFAYGLTKLQRNAFIAVCFVVPFFIAWQNFCLGGMIMRYIVDIMPLITIGAVVMLLRANVSPSKRLNRYCISAVSMFISFCLGWLMTAELRNGNLTKHCPNLYEDMERLIAFWR